MAILPFIILFTPFLAAFLITLFFKPFKKISVGLSIMACFISFCGAVILLLNSPNTNYLNWPWLNVGDFVISIGAMSDPLAKLMLLVVTGVGLLIHIFSYGYMHDDPGISRFFAKLSLFMFSMLGIVLANNLVMMFIFWELVGLSSYLLIGFWFERPSAVEAAKKAFIVNRIGDFGFILGILIVWRIFGSIDFKNLAMTVSQISSIHGITITLAALGLFCGCVGKSAQLPLHVWLPDAMEGPTPVSALIHAATMVAAGVYMLCRVFFILALSPDTLHVIAWTGGITALFAALIATQQNDIKRILAYSTLSQLGYMVMAVGLGAWSASMFHLTTHAFFKALLFLGAGSIIHSLHHEQDIWRMGGLWSKMRVTSWTFFIATAALMGVPLFSGFFSKEAILSAAFEHNIPLFVIGVFTAGLTTYYMARLWLVTFTGKARTSEANHAHESPAVMTIPLVILGILALGGGFLPIQKFLQFNPEMPHAEAAHWTIVGCSVLALLLGLGFAFKFYTAAKTDPIQIPLFKNKFYIDELYQATFVYFQDNLGQAAAWWDRWIIEGLLVRTITVSGTVGGEMLRLFQGGNLKAYVALFVLGALFLFYRVMFP
jgi:NADH-quinone oxidoreductase subunit L